MKTRTIKVDYLARVEGEGAIFVKCEGDRVVDVRLKIFEPPRLFEALLRGRDYSEAPDITARICGICPVAYQMSAVAALEDAFEVKIDEGVRALRRLLYCGEWIESHILHIALLHAPDFLGYDDAIQMAKDHRETIERALALKKLGNEIVATVGGREIHPINVRVGGFYKPPAKQKVAALVESLKRARDEALWMVAWVARLPFPDFEQDYEFVSLRGESHYPMNDGRIVSSSGMDITAREYEDSFVEEHVKHSNALHSFIKGRGAYLVGPLARYNLNFERLSPIAQDAARKAGLTPTCRNPYQSIIVRAVEALYAIDEALRLASEYEPPEGSGIDITPRAARGYGCTEAPRGVLYHRYSIDESGLIADAKIVPPTSQNQKTIESDLFRVAASNISLPPEKLTWQLEQTVRNYDPCISCATHHLRLHIERD